MSAPGKVLILGHDERILLGLTRSLGRYGCEVHAVVRAGATSPAALASRYLAAAHFLPPPVSGDSSHWTHALVELLDRERYQLVIPAVDSAILPIQTQPERFARFPEVYRLGDRAFATLFNKAATAELAREVGVPVPSERLVESVDALPELLDSFAFPMVLKPTASFTVDHLGSKHLVAKARDRDELERLLPAMLRQTPVLVQENVLGDGVGVELLVDAGRPLVAFQHRRLHQPLHGGGSSYRISEPVRPALLAAAEALLRGAGHSGVAMVEFIEEPRTGAFWLIEVNARFWGSLALCLAAGCDVPRYFYQFQVEGRRDFPAGYRHGLRARHLSADVEWLKANARADRRDPTLATRPWPSVLGEVRWLLAGRERWDTFAADDPRPGWISLRRLWGGMLRDSLPGRGCRKLWEVASLARPRAARRLRAAVARSSRVVFVCKGNICRSPFAERVARELWGPGVSVASSGHYPRAGRPSTDAARRVAATEGVDLTDHRSSVLDDVAVSAADLLLVFDRENEQVLLEQHPGSRGKVHLLGQATARGKIAIDDPYGHDDATYAACYRRIRALIAGLAPVARR